MSVFSQINKACVIVPLSMVLLAAISGTCRAEELLGDTIKPFVSISETYDSNIFRVKDQNQLKIQIGDDQLSDFITVVSLGTEVNYQASGQSLNLLLKHDFLQYIHYTSQNVSQDMISGNLALSVLDKIKLNLKGDYALTPVPRSDYVSSSGVNEQQTMSIETTIGYEMVDGIGFSASYRRNNLEYSLPQYRTSDYATDLYSGRVSYQISPDTSLFGSLQREYLNYSSGPSLTRNNYVADSILIGINRIVGAITTVSGYLGYLERRYNPAAGRNFGGLISLLAINYELTPSFTLRLYGERQLYEETYTNRIYSVSNALGAGLTYQVSNNVKASVFEKYTWKSFKDVPNSGVAGRSDQLNDLSAALYWDPLLRLSVSLGYQFSTRDSDEVINNFSAHSIRSSISYRY